jgi:hypothetical protein
MTGEDKRKVKCLNLGFNILVIFVFKRGKEIGKRLALLYGCACITYYLAVRMFESQTVYILMLFHHPYCS